MEAAVQVAIVLVIFMAIVFPGLASVLRRYLGVRFFRPCPVCKSRLTLSMEGWSPPFEPFGIERSFSEDIECSPCGKTHRVEIPKERWPSRPLANEAK